MATASPAPDPRRQPKNLVDPQADQAPPEVLEGGGEGDGQPQGNLTAVPTPPSKPEPKPLTGVRGGGKGDGKPKANLAPVPPAPVNKPPVDTAGVPDEPLLPEELPDEEDDDRLDPRDFEEKPEEDGREEEGESEKEGQGEQKGEKSGGKEKSGPEKGGPKPGAPSGGGLTGGAEKGLDTGAVDRGAAAAGEQLGKAATQGLVRAAIMNPYVLAGIFGFVVIFASIMGLVVATGTAANKTGSGGGSSSGQITSSANCEKLSGTPKDVVDNVVIPIAKQLKFDVTAKSVGAANSQHSDTTTSGNLSDHAGPPARAWAADISNGSSPTPQMDELARKLADCFGVKWSGSGGPTANKDGYRIQLIYRTSAGSAYGDHMDHVHIGIAKQ